MPIVDVAAQDYELDNDPLVALDGEAALFDDDPENGGVELDPLDCPGYARCPVTAADWNPSAAGIKSTVPLPFDDPTGPWETTATHMAIWYPSLSAWGDANPLSDPLDITEAGPFTQYPIFSIFYDNDVDPAY